MSVDLTQLDMAIPLSFAVERKIFLCSFEITTVNRVFIM